VAIRLSVTRSAVVQLAHVAIAPLQRVSRVAARDELEPQIAGGAHQILFGGADFTGRGADEAVAELGAGEQEAQLPVHRAVERVNRVDADGGDHQHERDEEAHRRDHLGTEAPEHHWPSASCTLPPCTTPM
jgi:hypothetical protein